jgi:hypothetical protein
MKARTDLENHARMRLFPLQLWAIGVSLLGCAPTADPEEDEGNLATVFAADRGRGDAQAQDITEQISRTPDGKYEARIVSSGAGCPPGTTRIGLTADARTFVLDFLQLGVAIDERLTIAATDCKVTIRMKSRAGMSFAIGEPTYQGTASLLAGMSARVLSSAELAPGVSWPLQLQTELTGPHMGDFRHVPEPRLADLVYTPCALESTFSITTRLMITNPSGTGRGSISLALTAVSATPAMTLPINLKSCTDVRPAN